MTDKLPIRTFSPGELLFKEGDPSGELWIIQGGEVEVFREREGRPFVLGTVGRGEILGTMTATTGAPRSASVRAVSEVEVSVIAADDVKKLLRTIPKWANAFIKDLVARVDYANELYVDAGLAAQSGVASLIDLAARVCHTLAGMADLIADGDKVSLDAAVDRVGAMLGFKGDVGTILRILSTTGHLPLGNGHVPLASALDLKRFADLIVKAQTVQGAGVPFQSPLPAGARKQLEEMLKLVAKHDNDEALEPQTLPLSQIEDAFRKARLGAVDAAGLERAAELGYVGFDKRAREPQVTLDPPLIAYVLKSLDAIQKILALGQRGPQRKTLIH